MTKASFGPSIRPRASRSRLDARRAGGAAEAEFIVGRADNAVWAADLVAARLGLPPVAEADLKRRFYETRAVEPSPALPSALAVRLLDDGKALQLTHRTPRPWAHVMANELGMATMVSNDGEVFSAFGNARQNGSTAFRSTARRLCSRVRSSICAISTAARRTRRALRRSSARMATFDALYEPGVATFTKVARRPRDATMSIFVPPDLPGDMRLLTLRNTGDKPQAAARRAVLRHRARREPERERRPDQ